MKTRRSNAAFSGAKVLAVFVAMFLAGFGRADCSQTAVVATVASDYTSGAHSVIAVDPIGGPRTAQNDLLPTISDITVEAHGRYFYRIERYMADNVTKFDIEAPDTPVWQFSTLDAGDSATGNPYAMIFASDQKAYLLRYGKNTAWIVNPSASTEGDFKLGELDLSAYADSDGLPEMNNGVIVDGKLFITLQRLDRDDSFAPVNDSYVAVFDTATDTELDTGTVNSEGLNGIVLPIKNTGGILYLESNGMIYVQGAGDYGSSWSGRDPEYSGGIVRLNPGTYAVEMIVDDGAPYGNISGISVISEQTGYFVGYAGWGDNTLYRFNPSNGVVDGPANAYLQNKSIAGMEAGAYADENQMLWVCNQTDAEVVILDTTDNSIDERVSTNLNPSRVVFTTEGEAGSASGGGSGSGGGCFIISIME